MSQTINDIDIEIITRQIGRKPRGNLSIGRKCSYGCPEVIITSPSVDGTFFPTTYWLTCPTRIKKINRLEGEGWIDKLEQRLAADSNCLSELVKATKAQVNARRLLADDSGDNFEAGLLESGIAGVADIKSVKCLHAHLADFLIAGINPVGKRVANMIGEISCSKDCLS